LSVNCDPKGHRLTQCAGVPTRICHDGGAQDGEHLPAVRHRGRGDAQGGGRQAARAPRGPGAPGPLIPLPTATRTKRVSPRVPSESAVHDGGAMSGRHALSRCRRARNQWWAGTGLTRRHQDFQTRLHLPARTDDLFVSVMTRAFLSVDLAYPSGSSRIETHDSVRVEFESTGAMRTARIRRKVKDPPGGSGAPESKGHHIFIDVPTPALGSRNRDPRRRRTAKAHRHLIHAEPG
jgi:hypothetical protein